MRSRLLALVVAAAAACGGSQKPPPPIPLPDDKPPVAETKPEEKPPEAPPKPAGPIDIPIPTRTLEVKLVNAGKGKKTKLALTPKAGEKTKIELALDFAGGQDGPEETGGKMEDVAPTALLVADVETTEVSDTGVAKFTMTFSAVDVKERPGQKVDSAKFKEQMEALLGATISGAVDPDGQLKDGKIRIEKPDQRTVGGLQFLALSMMPMWPVLPTAAVGTGAKWTVTSPEQVANQVDITKVVSYELVSKKGAVWTIKGSTAISGKEQKLEAPETPESPEKAVTTIGNIGGSGKHEIAITDGALMPTMKQSNTTTFTMSGDVPADPKTKAPARTVSVKFHIDQANTISSKN